MNAQRRTLLPAAAAPAAPAMRRAHGLDETKGTIAVDGQQGPMRP